jgi:predicted P-loop ATPase/GTPase
VSAVALVGSAESERRAHAEDTDIVGDVVPVGRKLIVEDAQRRVRGREQLVLLGLLLESFADVAVPLAPIGEL